MPLRFPFPTLNNIINSDWQRMMADSVYQGKASWLPIYDDDHGQDKFVAT